MKLIKTDIVIFFSSMIVFFILSSCNKLEKRKVFETNNSKEFISWKEHVIDDYELSGQKISGGDGLVIADIDKDGYEDIISVHEADWQYDGVPRGYIRIAFGTNNPEEWELVTLGEGKEVGAVEDVTIGDINNDGYLDIVAACELAHFIYFENPKVNIRSQKWQHLIPEIALNRGSFIRIFTADLNNDGKLEIITANKGSQVAKVSEPKQKPVSYFEILGNPLDNASWKETVLVNVLVPINSEPIDIDKDGDLDVLIGSRGENRLILMENKSNDSIVFLKHDIVLSKTTDISDLNITGFNMVYVDFNNDKLLDIILTSNETDLIWLEQPLNLSNKWTTHYIGTIAPDLLSGFTSAYINNDSLKDVFVGSYSRGSRTKDGNVTINDKLGCMAWFEHPKDVSEKWIFHPIVRRKRGMYDKFIVRDLDNDGDMDFIYTRGNSHPYDGVFWLEQIKNSEVPNDVFTTTRTLDS